MKNKPPLSKDEQQLFRESVAGAKKLRQDTIVHRPPKPKVKQITPQRLLQEQVDGRRGPDALRAPRQQPV